MYLKLQVLYEERPRTKDRVLVCWVGVRVCPSHTMFGFGGCRGGNHLGAMVAPAIISSKLSQRDGTERFANHTEALESHRLFREFKAQKEARERDGVG